MAGKATEFSDRDNRIARYAEALKQASDDLNRQGYRIKIYDTYRPQLHEVSYTKLKNIL